MGPPLNVQFVPKSAASTRAGSALRPSNYVVPRARAHSPTSRRSSTALTRREISHNKSTPKSVRVVACRLYQRVSVAIIRALASKVMEYRCWRVSVAVPVAAPLAVAVPAAPAAAGAAARA